MPSGPCLCGLCFRGGPPRTRFSVIVTPPIGRTHNEQVCKGFTVGELAADLGLTNNGVRAHLATLEREDTFVIRSYGCPLAAVVSEQPQTCDLVETLIAKLAGVRVREHCEHEGNPRCRFEVGPADGVAGR